MSSLNTAKIGRIEQDFALMGCVVDVVRGFAIIKRGHPARALPAIVYIS